MLRQELFDEFQEEPVASGSVGQVHRARLRPEHALDGPGGQLRDVAVKIQHPGVIDSAFMEPWSTRRSTHLAYLLAYLIKF